MNPVLGKFKQNPETIKKALVPILSILLAIILFWPNQGPDSQGLLPPIRKAAYDSKKTISTDSKEETRSQLPHYDLDKLVSTNLFGPSGSKRKASGKHLSHRSSNTSVPPNSHANRSLNSTSRAKNQPVASKTKSDLTHGREATDLDVGPVKAILVGDQGKAALIGSQIFQIGDKLNEQYRVVEISDQEVYLEPVE